MFINLSLNFDVDVIIEKFLSKASCVGLSEMLSWQPYLGT